MIPTVILRILLAWLAMSVLLGLLWSLAFGRVFSIGVRSGKRRVERCWRASSRD
jgi:hypothetical protein